MKKGVDSLNSLAKKNYRLQILICDRDSKKVSQAATKMFLDKSSFCRAAILEKTAFILSDISHSKERLA
jgi:hypothetical protein